MLKTLKFIELYTYQETFNKSFDEIFEIFKKTSLYNKNKDYVIKCNDGWNIEIFEIN